MPVISSAMPRRAFGAGLIAGCGSLLIGGMARAQSPSGSVEITQVQVAFLVSGNLGSGRLHFQGRTYPFSIGGLGAGGYGVSRIEADGSVYNLSRVDQFSGFYVSARYGVAVGQASSGELFLQTPHGVAMRLRARRQGLALSLGADGIEIRLK